MKTTPPPHTHARALVYEGARVPTSRGDMSATMGATSSLSLATAFKFSSSNARATVASVISVPLLSWALWSFWSIESTAGSRRSKSLAAASLI